MPSQASDNAIASAMARTEPSEPSTGTRIFLIIVITPLIIKRYLFSDYYRSNSAFYNRLTYTSQQESLYVPQPPVANDNQVHGLILRKTKNLIGRNSRAAMTGDRNGQQNMLLRPC